MNELEIKLRERTDVDNLLVLKVETTKDGKEAVEKINGFMSELIIEVRDMENVTNEISEAYSNVRYDLKTARHNLQYQMLRLARLNK